jgi:hypothetical protein
VWCTRWLRCSHGDAAGAATGHNTHGILLRLLSLAIFVSAVKEGFPSPPGLHFIWLLLNLCICTSILFSWMRSTTCPITAVSKTRIGKPTYFVATLFVWCLFFLRQRFKVCVPLQIHLSEIILVHFEYLNDLWEYEYSYFAKMQ